MNDRTKEQDTMKRRIRATFNPPAQYLRHGVLPEQVERECIGLSELAEQLRELVYAGDGLLAQKARLVIEIVPALDWAADPRSLK